MCFLHLLGKMFSQTKNASVLRIALRVRLEKLPLHLARLDFGGGLLVGRNFKLKSPLEVAERVYGSFHGEGKLNLSQTEDIRLYIRTEEKEKKRAGQLS